MSEFHSPFTDRSSRWFRLRRYIPRIFLNRRSERLSTQVFTRQSRATEFSMNRRMIASGAFVLFTALVGGFVLFSGFFSITKISVVRNSLDLPIAEIEKLVGKVAFGKNLFLIDTPTLAATVKKTRPDIARVIVTREPPNTISVEILKYPVVAELRVGSDRIFINENGYRVAGAQGGETGTIVLTLGEELDLTDTTKQLVNPAHLATMKNAADYATSLLDTKITAIRFFPVAREARLVTKNSVSTEQTGTELWLDLAQDYRTELDKLTLAKNIIDLKKGTYKYIDLRIFDKIFYKNLSMNN